MPSIEARPRWAVYPALAVALLLGACASHPVRNPEADGPPDHVPAGLSSTPDAVPRVEALNPNANRPYTALGRSYTPDMSDAEFEQRGWASWYGRQYHGNRTASGEPYDMFAMTAAHPTLPIPSYARVTTVRDGRSVVVRINDRGPFTPDRIIDLSYAAALRLGIANAGNAEVVVHKITAQEIAQSPAAAPPMAAAEEPAAPAVAPNAKAQAVSEPPPGMPPMALPVPAASSEPEAAPLLPTAAVAPEAKTPIAASAEVAAPPHPPVATPSAAVSAAGWAVQLGAFAIAANASALRDEIARRLAALHADSLPAHAEDLRLEQTGRLTRVLIGRVADRKSALALARRLQQVLDIDTALYRR